MNKTTQSGRRRAESQAINLRAVSELVFQVEYFLDALRTIIQESRGIDGYHLNGDIATWEEIIASELDIDSLEDAIAKVKEMP